MFRNAAGFHI